MRLRIRLLALVCLLSGIAKAQPQANFSATPQSGCAPLLVNFTDLSTGNPTYWKWDLGNGTISYLKNPSVSYFNPGVYTVKLTVQNNAGTNTITKTQYITVYGLPTVNFYSNSQSACLPATIQFFDSSIANGSNISMRLWDFGDGTLSNLTNPTHTYTTAGSYNVSLRVTTDAGCNRSITKSYYIRIYESIAADFSNSLQTSCTPPAAIRFTNLSTGSGTLQYSWNFGDGSTSSSINPTHNYSTTGSYNVRLITRNNYGCTDTATRINAVVVGTTQAAFQAGNRSCVNAPVTFINSSTPANAQATWNFGDGSSSTLGNPNHIFPATGTYTVKLSITAGSCRDSVSHQVVINPKPTAAFGTTDTSSCKAPYTVSFNNQSANISNCIWDFGDGSTSTAISPVHIYQSEGLFTVRLIAVNASGCTDTLTKNQLIKIKFPVASIDSMPRSGCAPYSWTFNSRLVSTEPAVSYLWDFGDGSTSTLAQPSHTFSEGLYTVKLIVVTSGGCTDTLTVPNAIRSSTKPTANFTAAPLSVCADTRVNFSDQSTGNITRYSWNFGDGGNSTAVNPNYQYSDTGSFSVTLIVSNNGCTDTLIRNNYVHVNPPIAILEYSIDCADKFKREFTGSNSLGADTYSWDFGDGTTSNVPNPVHVYATTGLYDVTLVVRNNTYGCESRQKRTLAIVNEHADFVAQDTIACRKMPVTFSAINSDPSNITRYNWNFGDGFSAISTRTISHNYLNAGYYNVSLITTDAVGCKDTMTKISYIRVNGPTARFSSSVSGTCLQSIVQFTDSSVSDGMNPINSWMIDYGDGTVQTAATPTFSHAYVSPGRYFITLTVTDTTGCSDRATLTTPIIISKPVAAFTSRDTLSCPGRTVTFDNNSSGPRLTHLWNFGDGDTSSSMNPSHLFPADGYYTVTLKITDQYGCTDSITRPNYIHLITGRAQFNMSDSFSNCPPLVVNFTNTSLQAVAYNWDFGDGNISQLSNPSHFYGMAGNYTVTLTAKSAGGCITTYQRNIEIKGPSGTISYSPLSGCKPLQVSFQASSINRDQIIWDFSDGNTLATQDSSLTHTYTIPGKYIPRLILRNNAGCQVAVPGTDTIFVQGAEANFQFNAPVMCNSGTVSFANTSTSSDGIATYDWYFGDGNSSNEISPSHNYIRSGAFFPQLIVTTASGCRDSIKSSIPVRISESPRVVIIRTPNACAPVTINFNSYLQNPDTTQVAWHWDFGNGETNSNRQPGDIIYRQSGVYIAKVIIADNYGCSDTATTIVTSYAIPPVNAGSDAVNCHGKGVNLQATGAATYTWTPSTGLSCNTCNNPIANPDSATQYIVTGVSEHGCVNKDSVFVKVKYPFEISVSRPDTICAGEATVLYAAGANSYSWTPSATPMGANNTIVRVNPTTTTTYQVTGSDDANCFTNTKQIKITVFPVPTVEAGVDKTINVGNTIELSPVISPDVTEVNWSPTGSISRSTYPSIFVKPRETTEYTVEVSNPGGCTARDRVTVFVTCDGVNVFIPNTFTPNGDGMNDIFFPRGSGLFSIRSLKIFNRWGEMIYQKADFSPNAVNAGWDGTHKGKALNPDVFVYVIEIVCENNSLLTYKGNITLLK